MKKLFIISVLILCVALGGCKKQENPSPAQPVSQATSEAASQTTSEPVTTSVTENLPEPVANIENLEGPLGTADVFGEDGEYAAHLVFKTNQDVKNFRFFKVDMTYNEESNSLSGKFIKEFGSREILKADEEVILIGDTGETLPFLAVSYESANGNTYNYAIQISGEDGSAFLTPFDISK